jgi:hypothetical protein
MSPARLLVASPVAVVAAALATLAGGNGQALGLPLTQTPPAPQASTPLKFGGAYSGLDPRCQKLVADWVARFNEVTGLKMEPEPFYDTRIKLSAKTTFDAVTNALMTTRLTDASGANLADSSGATYRDALDLVDRVDSVKGQILEASSDHQFRMYVRLKEGARALLDRSREFKRGPDNTVYHRGYPTSYRQQGGAPSIQISIATDSPRADIDVDYRTSNFPVSLFNGHLTSSNSDVRAGNNYDRHANRWVGYQNWWRSFFGVRVEKAPADEKEIDKGLIPPTPRVGDKNIEAMVDDFLKAWLVDGDIFAAMSYISERAYACLAQDGDDPDALDPGMAPFQLLVGLKAAHEAIGKREALEGLVVGVRLANPALRVVRQPHHAQFVVYSVPDDIAASFDCKSRLTLAEPKKARREYGNYFGATFFINGRKDYMLALLWGREKNYWRIVSWLAEPEDSDDDIKEDTPTVTTPAPRATMKADATLVAAAQGFLESWFIRKDYDAAFNYLAPTSYACYNLMRADGAPAAASSDEAAKFIRAAIERAGTHVGKQAKLDDVLEGVTPSHPAVRLLSHPYSRAFALTSVPNAIASAADCAARAKGESFNADTPLEYGKAFGMNFRFRTQGGETPVLRMLWIKENDAWRIALYDVEYP